MRIPIVLSIATVTLLTVGGCGGKPGVEAVAAPPPAWQKQIRDDDRKRLAGLWGAWTRSMAQVDAAGMQPMVAALGPMAMPDAAQPAAPPSAGRYRCRAVRLGSRDEPAGRRRVPTVVADPFGPCTIARRGALLWFEQDRGAQRVAGALYPDGDRQVFLGSLALAGETGVMAYGADGERDQVGVLRSVGPGRWRLELPWPMWQSNLEIIEIVAG